MNVTPIQAAKISNARRVILEILTARQCMYAEEAARMVMDELRKLGWTPPGWRDDDAIPRPASSTPAGRAAARRLFEEARAHRRTCAADADPRPEEEK